MTTPLEIAANLAYAASVLLAGRNNLHTWWTGIVGCILFALVYYQTKLYADVTLQLFFILTSVTGWWAWFRGIEGKELPIRRVGLSTGIRLFLAAVIVTLLYGWLLRRFTDAYAPFADSVILAFSVLGQFLLMARRYETWWCWLLVNTIAIPLYCSRGLYLTALLYSAFWINAVVALVRWKLLLPRP
jgi:nicotinamide mononucleotide transporter